MTVWIIEQELSPEQEENIQRREYLILPFEGLPDLSRVSSERECRRLMQGLHPEDPPESLAGKSERLWKMYAGLEKEDVVAVPLHARREVALAEVSARYRFELTKEGSPRHLLPVTWIKTPVPFRRFGRHQSIFMEKGGPVREVVDPEARIALRDRLPHRYNRFARWKWLAGLFLLMSLLRLIQQMKLH